MFKIDELGPLITERKTSLFLTDITSHRGEIDAAIRGRRILVIGGAGSIGASTIQAMLPFEPAALHVIDINENSLAELVRGLRSSAGARAPRKFLSWAFDYGSPIFGEFLKRNGPYDLVLNFSAVKHVRAERDPFSLWHLLQTNVLKQKKLQDSVRSNFKPEIIFSVSTDKAANPTSAMGASKRIMERVLFSDPALRARSARFANVAFSNGSLLQGFLYRIAKREPFSVPKDTRRYFVSLEESGHICLLAMCLMKPGEIAIPKLDPESKLILLQEVATRVLGHYGFKPEYVGSEEEARTWFSRKGTPGLWPVLLTPLDTSGEKPYEEFLGTGERKAPCALETIEAIHHGFQDSRELQEFVDWLGQNGAPNDSEMIEKMQKLVPSFAHRSTGKNLDQRM